MNLAQYLDEIGTGAATRIEHIDTWVRKTVRDAQFCAQHQVNARDHVLDDLNWRVPDAQLFAQLRIECLQEWFVEILDRVAFFKVIEERFAVDAVEYVGSPVKHLDDI